MYALLFDKSVHPLTILKTKEELLEITENLTRRNELLAKIISPLALVGTLSNPKRRSSRRRIVVLLIFGICIKHNNLYKFTVRFMLLRFLLCYAQTGEILLDICLAPKNSVD
ncbi:hypothetical protein K2173_005947 [Erythroxylum novogranatense]|uniref:Uncharacterized protein n=1 Tax=Erythroxylum novogranatense TaxID=1862640 RepID=A0AAV8TTC6_9ROSI|nr:hypothetical protein K2173_005947 [Erythroxylum novogranatense]